MPRYVILAQSNATANALGVWLELLGENPLDEKDQHKIVWERQSGRQGALEAYETLVRRIEIAASDGDDQVPLNKVVALVDAVNPSRLSAVAEGGSWDSLIAMLILTFPEIRWVFGVTSEVATDYSRKESIESRHTLVSLLEPAAADPLFDPTGLRDWVRARTGEGLNNANDDLKLPRRQQLAAAIDEERPYAYLHGYTAYRFGCRADVVSTWTLMKDRFGKADGEPHGYWLLLEDMSLNFPDREKGKHLLHLDRMYYDQDGKPLEGRAHHCPKLDLNSVDGAVEDSKYRILVTTGQTRPGDHALSENRRYLRGKAPDIGKVVFKPASGMFDLWEKAGLYLKLAGSQRLGNAPDFCWPPAPLAQASEKADGHGAPGKLLLVSEMLVRRAEAMLGKVKCVDEAVHGAVLATDALELTGGRTPTAAIEALSLKHQFEVLAECQFSGVEYHIKVIPRLKEISLEIASISRWFYRNERQKAKLNGQMHILNALVKILRAHGQFDEEQLCMHRVRRLHSTLWMRSQPWRFVFLPFIRYVEMLLKSVLGFVGAISIWLVILSLLFALFPAVPTAEWSFARLLIGVENAVTSFFSIGTPMQEPKLPDVLSRSYVFVSALCIMSGFLHLGVLISHLYAVVSRR
ncbi:MAG: hypothetical protein NT159_19365 [Proteobacteria bacterium]|nr:hypothetical protein [Pseudomonadota bacterium]